MRIFRRALTALILFTSFALSSAAQTYTPKAIRFDAPASVDTAEALRIAALPANAPLTKQQIEAALQRLGDTGLFSDVGYTVSSAALIIKLIPAAGNQLQPVHFSNFVWWQPAELETLLEAKVPAYHGKLPLAGTLTDQVKAALVKNLHEAGRMAALRTMIGLSKGDTAAIISQSPVAALVVMGTRDPDFPDAAAEARWLAEQLGAGSLIVEGAGHYPHAEMPDRITPQVLSFIRGVHDSSSNSL